MTTITFQDGTVLFRDGKAGTEAGCCCGQCRNPCINYCCPDGGGPTGNGFAVRTAFYVGSAGGPTFINSFDCSRESHGEFNLCAGRQVSGSDDYDIDCNGVIYRITITTCADLICRSVDENNALEPGCGRDCELIDPVVTVTGVPFPPCFDETNIVFMFCTPCT